MSELNWSTKAHFTFRKLACTHSSVVAGLYDYLLNNPAEGRRHLEELKKDGNYVLPLIDACLDQYDISGIAEHWPRSLKIKFVQFPKDDEITKDVIITCSTVYLPWNVKLSTEQIGDEEEMLGWMTQRMELQKDRHFPFLNDPEWSEPLPDLSDEPHFRHIYGLGRIIEHIRAIVLYKRKNGTPPKQAKVYNTDDIKKFLYDSELGAFGSKDQMEKYINLAKISIKKDLFDFAEIRSEEGQLYIDLPGQYLDKNPLTSNKKPPNSKFNDHESSLFECTGFCSGFMQNADVRI